MMKKSQVSADMTVLFASLVVIAVYAFATFFFVNNTDNARIGMAQEQWRNEAIYLTNYIVSSPNCLGYIKNFIHYDNTTSDELITGVVGVPNAIDSRKFNMERLSDCLRMSTPEYSLFFEIEISDESGVIFKGANGDKNANYNPATYQLIRYPVKIIFPDSVSYGQVEMGISVNVEFFNTRIV